MTTKTPRRSREPVLVLRRVSVSGPIAAFAAARLQSLGGGRQALAVDARRVRKEGPQGGSARRVLTVRKDVKGP